MTDNEPTVPDLLTETNGNKKIKIEKKNIEDLQEEVNQLQFENEKFKNENAQLRYFIFKIIKMFLRVHALHCYSLTSMHLCIEIFLLCT